MHIFLNALQQERFWHLMPAPPEERTRKLLISLNNDKCPFSRQANQGLDFQGLARWIQRLSTKLSTEILGKCHIFLQINDLPEFPQQ